MLCKKACGLGITKDHPGKSVETGFSTGMGIQIRMKC